MASKTSARSLPEIRQAVISKALELRDSFYRTLVVGLGANAVPVAVTGALLVVDYGFPSERRITASLVAVGLVASLALVFLKLKPWARNESEST